MSASRGIEHFEDDELRPWGDACNAAAGVGAVTGDDAGDVGPVAETVFRDSAAAGDAPGEVNYIPGKVYIVDDALAAAAIGEIVVPADDARVDYSDADPGAIDAKVCLADTAPTVSAVRSIVATTTRSSETRSTSGLAAISGARRSGRLPPGSRHPPAAFPPSRQRCE